MGFEPVASASNLCPKIAYAYPEPKAQKGRAKANAPQNGSENLEALAHTMVPSPLFLFWIDLWVLL